MSKEYIIAPSILAADCARLGEECEHVIKAGADYIHFDVMDNHYVPNLTLGPLVCRSLRQYGVKAPIDVHLMVSPVDSIIPEFAKAGASIITVHPEATLHLDRTIRLIKSVGCKVGLAFNPATPLDYLDHVMEMLDLILVMSVNPGFGGQKFIASSLYKIQQVRQRIKETGKSILLEVDGGITVKNIKQVAVAGADTFVAGSAIFSSGSYSDTIQQMRKSLSQK